MIYRIAIYENGRFSHYADEHELEFLRVSANGKVEELKWNSCYNNDYGQGGWINLRTLGSFWQDVSDTHEVEWGTHLRDWNTTIYVDDVIETISGKGVVCLDEYGFYYQTIHGDCNMYDIAVNGIKTLYGNIHENPKLIEEE